jgi:nucleotide-binding universal stress UspA family protein
MGEMVFTTIAWAADGSPSSRNALTAAKQLVQATGARMLVLHVQELGITRAGLLVDTNDHVLVSLRDTVVQLRKEGIEAELTTGKAPAGGADRMILELAEEAGVDILVIGNRGHGPLAGLFVGSVTLRVIQHAPFPVLLVPSGRRPVESADHEHELEGAAAAHG